MRYKPKYDLKNQDNVAELIKNTEPVVLGKYLTEAFSERKSTKNGSSFINF